MKIGFSGAFKSRRTGSWQCRGEQMADALRGMGVETFTAVRGEVLPQVDILVTVKKADREHVDRARKQGAIVVHDILDGWPKPDGNKWTREQAITWVLGELAKLKPDAVVAATGQMARDINDRLGILDIPVLPLRHHARPMRDINPIREKVKVLSYEGGMNQLAEWHGVLLHECRLRNWTFRVNPKQLAETDIVVALRGDDWRGYMPDQWKSNVKMANAQATGTPIVCMSEAGYRETVLRPGAARWVETLDGLAIALDYLTDRNMRMHAHRELRASADHVRLDTVAKEYLDWLSSVRSDHLAAV